MSNMSMNVDEHKPPVDLRAVCLVRAIVYVESWVELGLEVMSGGARGNWLATP